MKRCSQYKEVHYLAMLNPILFRRFATGLVRFGRQARDNP